MGMKKGVAINQAWEYLSHLPLDVRKWTESLADLKTKKSYETYEGMTMYCDEKKEQYVYSDKYTDNTTYGKFRPKQGYITKQFVLTAADLVENTNFKYKIKDDDLFTTDNNYEKYKMEFLYTVPNYSIKGCEVFTDADKHYMLVEVEDALTNATVASGEVLRNLKVIFTYIGNVCEANS